MNRKKEKNYKAKRGLLCMIFLTLKKKAAGGKSMTVPHRRFTGARGGKWNEGMV
jgi:hypothetical protein